MLTNPTNFDLKAGIFFISKCGLVNFRQDVPNVTKKDPYPEISLRHSQKRSNTDTISLKFCVQSL